jgi:hypothetical protein
MRENIKYFFTETIQQRKGNIADAMTIISSRQNKEKDD